MHLVSELIHTILSLSKRMNRVLRCRLKHVLSPLVMEMANLLISVTRKFPKQIMENGVDSVEHMFAITNLSSYVFGQDVHEHPVQMDIGEVGPMQAPECGPFSKPCLKLGLVRALGETQKSPEPSHDHLLGAALVLLIERPP